MQSLLLVHKNRDIIQQEILFLCEKEHIVNFDRIILDQKETVGIEAIRTFQKPLFLTPLKGEKKMGIIYNADMMTVDAQNALLKTLEEPPPHCMLILAAQDVQSFLPTILSRVTIRYIEKKLQEPESSQINFPSLSIGEKLTLAQNLAKNKEEAILFLENYILYVRNQLITANENQERKKIIFLLRQLQKSYIATKKTNANLRLLLESTFLSSN